MITKKMNLLPIEYQKYYEVDAKGFLNKLLLIISLIVIASLVIVGGYLLNSLEKDVATLENQKQLLLDRATMLTDMRGELDGLEERYKSFNNLAEQPILLSQIIHDINENTPKDIWYSSIDVISEEATQDYNSENNSEADAINSATIVSSDARIQLHGYGQNVSSVGALAYLLNQVSYIESITIEHSSEIEINGKTLVEFMLSGYVRD